MLPASNLFQHLLQHFRENGFTKINAGAELNQILKCHLVGFL